MENSMYGNEWLDNTNDVYTAANYYNGITGFPYASNDVINIENVFQVDKADLKTGPTLAQLNANDDWDSLDLDELLASAQSDIRNFSKARSKYGTNCGYNRNNNNPLNIVSSNHSIESEYDSKLQENIDYLTSLLYSSKNGSNRPIQANSTQLYASNDMKLLSTTSPTPTPPAIVPQEFLSQNTSQTYSSQQNNTNTNTINNHNLLSNLLSSQTNSQELSNDNNIQSQQTSTVISDGNNASTNENINRVRNNSMSTEYSVSSHDEGFASQQDDSDNEDDDLSSDDESFYGDYDASDLLGASTSDDANNKWSLNMGRSRKGGERRYFWQYNVQSKGPKGTRIVAVEENGDPHILKEISDPVFSPDCRIEGVKHSGKARRGDGNDLTPNPKKLLMIGLELKKLSKIINDLTPVAEVPITSRGKSRKEKNKLASRACRLKKKAQHEANKIKLYGLQQEHKKLMSLLLEVRKLTRKYPYTEYALQEQSSTAALEKIIKQKGPLLYIAGKTSEFVNHILDNVSAGISNGGLDKI